MHTPVPALLRRLAAHQEGLLSTRQCSASGISAPQLKRMIIAQGWTRVATGVVDTMDDAERRELPDSYAHRRRRSALIGLLTHPEAVGVGVTALTMLGVAGLPLTCEPEIAMATGRLVTRSGVRVRRYCGFDTVHVHGFTVAAPTWAIAQAVPTLGRRHAVAVMDSAMNTGLITATELCDARDLAKRRRGVARTRDWWALADGRAESPLETAARLECIDAGIPPDGLQVVFTDSQGRFIARADLAWRVRGDGWLVVEIDGAGVHGQPEALYRDRVRQNDLQYAGVTVLRFTAADLRTPGLVGGRVRDHLRRARCP